MARQAFEVRGLADADLDRYDRLAREYGTVFDTVAWTGLFGDSIARYGIHDAGGALRGGFCAFREKRLGLTVLRNPPLTPSIGPFFESRARHPVAQLEERRDVLTALAEFLDQLRPAMVSVSLARWVSDGLPFYWRNYKVVPQYTYLLPLDQTEEALLAAMSVGRRNDIQKAIRDGLNAERTDDYSTIADMVETTFARQGKEVKRESMKSVLFSFARPDNSYAFTVRSNGAPVAGVFVIHDSRTAYYLLGGYGSESNHHGAGALAVFAAIRHARELGLHTFDFEGSVILPIEKYFRGFGGNLSPYYRVNKASLPLEMALKLTRRGLF